MTNAAKPSAAVAPVRDGWILIAGTGLLNGVPANVCYAAAAVGRAIADHGCGLVTGGWHGVDYLAAQAFSEAERTHGRNLAHRGAGDS